MQGKRFPDFFYNWASMAGLLIAVTSFAVIVLLFVIDFFAHGSTVYLGIFTYVVIPAVLFCGIVLMFVGAYFERRRILQGRPSDFRKVFTLDLNQASHRNAAAAILAGTVVFLIGTGVGTYKTYEMTESVAFCGLLCHSVMRPEHTAYQNSAHARVPCAQCHIGPGADWFVKSKVTGAYQIYATLFNKHPRPIPTPIEDLRPARETCLQCHWQEKFFGARRNIYPHYLSDEKNTPYPVSLLVKIGGGSEKTQQTEGIHWHMIVENKVEYIHRDRERMEIAWVRATKPDGTRVEYQDPDHPLSPEDRANAQVRTMDCMDCHNRPSHNYRSPLREVNEAMARRAIPTDLPYVKREAVKALDQEYPDTPTALREIRKKIEDFYAGNYAGLAKERSKDIERAAQALQTIYQKNFFPEMKVSWRKYPDHLGHFQSVGCFRCHGSALASPEGKTITNDCNICHTILQQGAGPQGQAINPQGLAFKHPVDIGGMEAQGNCASCHSGGAELY